MSLKKLRDVLQGRRVSVFLTLYIKHKIKFLYHQETFITFYIKYVLTLSTLSTVLMCNVLCKI